MAKIDPYLRSIEKFGAAGAVLTSGQPITLKFPAGDRNATQVVGHDQLVQMVREIAPPQALDLIDGSRPARFDYDSNNVRYTVTVSPKPGVWQVVIEAAAAAAPATAPRAPRADASDLAIERGQYAEDGGAAAATASGSTFLDAITHAARGLRASDIVIATGAPPLVRANGKLEVLADRGALDAETVSRELGIVAPADARGAWSGQGSATFTY
ncbi:MAG TPA: hypothetical protein VFQ65_20930, partial [Kofleriaceae bacterium]|nr:hypothetical protein [Kofleriaceae bacterium]